ncbi:hypothetical protein JYU34_003011 [Plutella xylostella]|uniref:Fibronectin type-III domain-containing protein n=1 Tax=Plutella xylostella TaxID=51655 RepID=A0ABQ7QYY6_PLUXY|nr:hypothetical protein JYU34_003011 [Plutella xylostella]
MVRGRGEGGRGEGGRDVRYTAQVALLPARDARVTNITLHAEPDPDGSSAEAAGYSARVGGLRPAAAYSLRLLAANHAGASPASEPLLFTMLEEGTLTLSTDTTSTLGYHVAFMKH